MSDRKLDERAAALAALEAESRLRSDALDLQANSLGEREGQVLQRESLARVREESQHLADVVHADLENYNTELRAANEKLILATLEAQELKEAAQMAGRRQDEYLAMLAHELRNPLGPIRIAVEVIARLDGKRVPETILDIVRRQVQQMVRLLDDLLDIARITQGKVTLQLQPTAVAEVIAQAVETCSDIVEAKHHTLTLELPDSPLFVNGDPARLLQIVANLLQNAAKYTQQNGNITVIVSQHANSVLIRVRDDGMGIGAETLPFVFDLFTQDERTLSRVHGGLGIGLTVVRRMTEAHGGTVEAYSHGRGRGSEFVVTLPCMEQERDADFAAPRVAISDPTPTRILVVEDNADAAEILGQLLRLAGHDVAVANDGPAGLEMFERTQPRVVLCDIGLPGMDGYEAVARMRDYEHHPRPSIIAITGYGGAKATERALAVGFDHYMIKPVDPEALLSLINSTL